MFHSENFEAWRLINSATSQACRDRRAAEFTWFELRRYENTRTTSLKDNAACLCWIDKEFDIVGWTRETLWLLQKLCDSREDFWLAHSLSCADKPSKRQWLRLLAWFLCRRLLPLVLSTVIQEDRHVTNIVATLLFQVWIIKLTRVQNICRVR